MKLVQVWAEAQRGHAIARRAWGRSRPALRITGKAEDDPLHLGKTADVVDHANLGGEDLDGEDWYVVPDA